MKVVRRATMSETKTPGAKPPEIETVYDPFLLTPVNLNSLPCYLTPHSDPARLYCSDQSWREMAATLHPTPFLTYPHPLEHTPIRTSVSAPDKYSQEPYAIII